MIRNFQDISEISAFKWSAVYSKIQHQKSTDGRAGE